MSGKCFSHLYIYFGIVQRCISIRTGLLVHWLAKYPSVIVFYANLSLDWQDSVNAAAEETETKAGAEAASTMRAYSLPCTWETPVNLVIVQLQKPRGFSHPEFLAMWSHYFLTRWSCPVSLDSWILQTHKLCHHDWPTRGPHSSPPTFIPSCLLLLFIY